MYLAGHDHDLEHLSDGVTDYFISGGGGAGLYGHNDGHEKLKWVDQQHGFMVVEVVGGGDLQVQFVDQDGKNVYSTTIEPTSHHTI